MISLLRKASSMTYCQRAFIHKTLKKTIIADVTQDIDVEKMRLASLPDTFVSDSSANTNEKNSVLPRSVLGDILAEEVEQRCFNTIQNLNDEMKRNLKVIQLEYDFLYAAEGHELQSTENVTSRTWLEALTFPTKEERLRFYFKTNAKISRQAKLSPSQTTGDNQDDQSIIMKQNDRLSHAVTHETPLLLDMGFSHGMYPHLLDMAAHQLWEMYRTNRQNLNPFHLMLTSCPPSNPVYRYCQLFHAVEQHPMILNVKTEDCTDLFKRPQMVYLSSKAFDCITDIDPSTIYVIGAYMTEKEDLQFKCVPRAQQLNVSYKRLPIDEHVSWPKAPKNLDLQDMITILLAVRNGQSWKEAFEYILKHGSVIPDWIKEGKVDNNINQQSRRWKRPKKFVKKK